MSQAGSHSARKSVEWVMAAGFSVRIEVEKVLLFSDRPKSSLHHVESPSADGYLLVRLERPRADPFECATHDKNLSMQISHELLAHPCAGERFKLGA